MIDMKALKRLEGVAEARNELAAIYRDLRRRNPAVARMTWRAIKRAEREAFEQIFSGSSPIRGGLAELLREPGTVH
jgi:hypothetical protein